jgi:hypothetical protein
MTVARLAWAALAGAFCIQVGCGDEPRRHHGGSDGGSNVGGGNTGGNGAGAGSVGGNAGGGAVGGGSGNCTAGLDTPCEQCGAMSCPTEAQACADESTCDIDGTPTAGCLALVTCAAELCGGGDIACIASMCSDELGSCSPGACQDAAQGLGDCITANCSAECGGGAGGSGGFN